MKNSFSRNFPAAPFLWRRGAVRSLRFPLRKFCTGTLARVVCVGSVLLAAELQAVAADADILHRNEPGKENGDATADIVRSMSEKGRLAMREGDYKTAIESYSFLLAGDLLKGRDKEKVAVYCKRGDAYSEAGDYDKAIKDFTAAIGLDATSPEAYCGRGIAFYFKGETHAALGDYNEAIRLDPKNSRAFNNRGNVYDDQGHHDVAMADYNEAVRLDPANAQAYYDRGIARMAKGEPQEALKDYSKAIELNPSDPRPYNNRGNLYDDLGQPDKAIADYDASIRINPHRAHTFFNRGNAYVAKGDQEKAVADFTEAIRMDPQNTSPYVNRGNAYQRKGEFDKAIADYDRAIAINPKEARTHNSRGSSYLEKKEYAKAIADFQEAIADQPDYKLPYINLATLLATCPQENLRDGKKAVEYALKACELAEWKIPGYLEGLAEAYAEAGDFENAVKTEQRYLDTPGLPENMAAAAKVRLELYQSHKAYHDQ